MSGTVSLFLIYQVSGGPPLTLARSDSRGLFKEAAKQVLAEAESRAKRFAEADQVLGEVEYEEVARLRRVLALVAPEVQTGADDDRQAVVM